MDFWWEAWPEHNWNEDGDAPDWAIESMYEAFALAWEQGIDNPDQFFDVLHELGYEVYAEDWDTWREWYDAL